MSTTMEAAGVRVITVTVSDTRSTSDDLSGPIVREALIAAGAIVVKHVIVKDEPADLTSLMFTVSTSDEADAVVLTGGTGIAPRDTTPDALAGLYTKTLDGFGEAFRRLSWSEIGVRAVFSRASAGVIGTLVVFSLPGSPRGAALGTRELVVPMLRHAVDLARGHHSHSHLHSHTHSHAPEVEDAQVAAPSGNGHAPARTGAGAFAATAIAAITDAAANAANAAPQEVRVLYFAALRDYARTEEESLLLPATVRTIESFLAHVATVHPELAGRLTSIRVASNERIANLRDPVAAGDVLALLPPFAGG